MIRTTTAVTTGKFTRPPIEVGRARADIVQPADDRSVADTLAAPTAKACGWSSNDKRWMWSLSTSTAAHLLLLGILACFWFTMSRDVPPASIHSVWVDATDEPKASPLEVTATASLVPSNETTLTAGGSSVSVFAAAEPTLEIQPRQTSHLSVAASSTWADANLAEQLDLVGAAIGQMASGGSGSGSGEGQGNGDGDFFGIRPVGKRFVFVLDCSGSMNRPHNSEAKTRFKRLKLELVRTIGRMTPEQEFYIVFFNAFAIPMPTSVPAAAVPSLKEKFLYWMAGIQADGETEPTRALQLALQMRPDVVYFLTDGTFSYRVEQELLKLPKGRTKIHTFAFREPFNEAMATAYKLIEEDERALARKAASKGEFRKAFQIWKSHQFLKQLAKRHHGGNFYLIP